MYTLFLVFTPSGIRQLSIYSSIGRPIPGVLVANDGTLNPSFLPKSSQLLLPTDLITSDGKGAVVKINGQDGLG